jgi:hypothetical protein
MNAKVITSKKRVYHTNANAEFTGFYEGMTYPTQTPSAIFDYHLFIKYGDKVYMEAKGIGEVVIPFAELKKNKYWKHYYDLSLLLSNDDSAVVEELKYGSEYEDIQIYDEPRFWSIDTAYIEYSVETETSRVVNSESSESGECRVCYYKINPFDLETMDYTTPEDLDIFRRKYMMRSEILNKVFDTRYAIYNDIVVDYALHKVEDADAAYSDDVFKEIAEDNRRYYEEEAAKAAAEAAKAAAALAT